jgi:hypothetical protein
MLRRHVDHVVMMVAVMHAGNHAYFQATDASSLLSRKAMPLF